MPHLLLEGNAASYHNDLSSAPNATLVDVSEDFDFQIQTIEAPALQVHHVSTHGQATNRGELPEAFMALMLSFRPAERNRPRFQGANFALACRQSQLHQPRPQLKGSPPASLVQLITEAYFNRLGQEHRLLLGLATARNANAASHLSLAIEWMLSQLGKPVNLQQLADTLALSPMRWLRLARISKLRQFLWNGEIKQLSIQPLNGPLRPQRKQSPSPALRVTRIPMGLARWKNDAKPRLATGSRAP